MFLNIHIRYYSRVLSIPPTIYTYIFKTDQYDVINVYFKRINGKNFRTYLTDYLRQRRLKLTKQFIK